MLVLAVGSPHPKVRGGVQRAHTAHLPTPSFGARTLPRVASCSGVLVLVSCASLLLGFETNGDTQRKYHTVTCLVYGCVIGTSLLIVFCYRTTTVVWGISLYLLSANHENDRMIERVSEWNEATG